MKNIACVALLCLPLAGLLAGCVQQLAQEEQQEKAPELVIPPPLHLGAVHQVYPEQNFALLRMIGPIPAPGTTLITHPADGSNDRVGNLCVSNATGSRNGIIAADIRSGTVVKGDRVFRYREIAPPESREQDADDLPPAEDDTLLPEEAPRIAPAQEFFSESDGTAEPEPENPQSVETSVLPETPAVPTPSLDTVPDSIRDVPDNINAWEN